MEIHVLKHIYASLYYSYLYNSVSDKIYVVNLYYIFFVPAENNKSMFSNLT